MLLLSKSQPVEVFSSLVELRQRLGCLRLSRHQRPQHLRNVAQLPGKVQSVQNCLSALYLVLSCVILCYLVLFHLFSSESPPSANSNLLGIAWCSLCDRNSGPQISTVCPGCNLRHYRANVCGTVLLLKHVCCSCEDRRSGPSTGQDRRRSHMPSHIASNAMNH